MRIEDIALTFVEGLGTKGTARLLDCFGSAEAIFAAPESDFFERAGFIRAGVVKEILSRRAFAAAEKELRRAERYNIVPIASTDDTYPPLLRECPDAPHVIYAQGDLSSLGRRAVAFVGTRDMTVYGQRSGTKIIEQLSELVPDTVVVSGLALGNDGNAHRAALQFGLKTVAVIANALPDIAPAEHRNLADRILLAGGAVITEITSQAKNKGDFFPSRNRIIAGMSSATVVVESPYEGGSMLTADYAFGYGRDVMAVPGRMDDKLSYGCNLLIKQNKAAMVCSGSDIIRLLGWEAAATGKPLPAQTETVNLTADERRLYDSLGSGEAAGYDTLAFRNGMSAASVASIVVSLELCGLVRTLPGRICEKI